MEGYEKKEDNTKNVREEIYSKVVRAGKRTYFFDVKATKKNDYYLTLTESKKIFDGEGRFHFEKHKLFLYKEDFDKFHDGLTDVISFIKNAQKDTVEEKVPEITEEENTPVKSFSDVEFEDLGSEN